MTRNTIRRVEVAAPVLDEKLKARIYGIFRVMLADNVKARIQLPDGSYVHKSELEEYKNAPALSCQDHFIEKAYERAERQRAARQTTGQAESL